MARARPSRSPLVALVFLATFFAIFFSMRNLILSASTTVAPPMNVMDDAPKARTPTFIKEMEREDSIVCTWKPGNDGPCINLLVMKLQNTAMIGPAFRWIFLGDSTMSRMFKSKRMLVRLNTPPCDATYTCRFLGAKQCGVETIFGYPRPETWKPPQMGMEGPRHMTPYCSDCKGCDSSLMFCRPNDNYHNASATISLRNEDSTSSSCKRLKGFSGGYLSIEYARDVEIQSTLHGTTQENLAQWFHDHWNTPEMVRDLGRPVCVVSTGIHDAAIANMTLQVYLQNVHSYLRLLIPHQCSLLIWLANTSPATDDYKQTLNQTREWNLGVLNLLRTHFSSFSSSVGYVDVFEASIQERHADNIHMSSLWYKNLHTMFTQVLDALEA